MTEEEFTAILISAPVRFVNWTAVDMHVTPQDDWFDHPADRNCPCSPFQDPQNVLDINQGRASKYLWVHRQIKYQKENLN